MPVVRGARLVGYLDGTIPAPPEELAVEKDISGKPCLCGMERKGSAGSILSSWLNLVRGFDSTHRSTNCSCYLEGNPGYILIAVTCADYTSPSYPQ
jgi:hypothetical protein